MRGTDQLFDRVALSASGNRTIRFIPLRVALALILSVPLMRGIVSHSASAAESEAIVRVERWIPANLPEGANPWLLQLHAASERRLLYGLLPNHGDLLVYNLDSLKPIGGRTTIGAADAATVDAATGDLVAAFAGTSSRYVAVFHVNGGTVTERVRVDLSSALAAGQRVLSIALADNGRRAFLLSMVDALYQPGTGKYNLGAPPGTLTITSVDLAGGRGEWSEVQSRCPLPVSSNTPPGLGYVAETNSVYFACSAPHTPQYKYPPTPTGVGRLVLGDTRTFELFPRAGDYVITDSAFDPVSGRLLLGSQTSGAGLSYYAFDGSTNSWVGAVAAGTNSTSQLGIDVLHSRMYALSGDGLVAADVGATPVSQGTWNTSFTTTDGALPKQQERIVVDEKRGRIFLKYTAEEIVVAEDRSPYFVAPVPPDPDSGTTQVDERPGVTGANYGGAAQGFGARYRFVGGHAAMTANLSPIDLSRQEYPLGSGTREISGAPLRALGLRNEGADATAIGGDRDVSNTGKDLQHGGAEWPFTEARCIDLGDNPTTASHPGATVECEAGAQASASASSGGSQVSGPGVALDLGSSTTSASTRLDPQRGMVTEVTATANDIRLLGGALKFGGVEVKATAQAHGRTGTAKSTYVRSVRDVSVNGTALCGQECDEQAVARTVNATFVGVLRVDFPTPDPTVLASDGGFQSIIRLRPEEHLEAVMLNEQPNDRIEVPGMVVSLFSDNTRPSRTILQFAGAAAEARYGIYLLGSGSGDVGSIGGSATDAAGLDVALDAFLGGGAGPNGSTPLGTVPISDNDSNPPRGLAALGWAYLRNALPETIALLLVWSILLAPVYLSARRRMLLERSVLSPGVRA